MMPVVRISEETYARMQKHAKPFEDTPDSIIVKALTALDMIGEQPSSPPTPTVKRNDTPKLAQKEFRVPLLVTLLKMSGKAQAKDVRNLLGPIMAERLLEGDYESVSTGDPRWWNAACWERSDMVKDGLMRDDSERGVWEISEDGRALAATLHRREGDTDRSVAHGTLEEMAARYWRRPVGPRPFIMVGDVVFDPVLLRKVTELEISVRSDNCLRNEGIVYIGDLVRRSEDDMLRSPNFGRKGLHEIRGVLEQLGLRFAMNVPGGTMMDFE